MSVLHIINVNLQRGFGGGEVYTAFFLRALASNGLHSILVAHPEARSWNRLAPGTERIAVDSAANLPQALADAAPAWLVFHTLPSPELAEILKGQGHFVTCFAHMPLYGRDPAPLAACDVIFPVSGHVRNSVLAAGLNQVYPDPLYGIADLRGRTGNGEAQLLAASPYDWDRRKFRDRLLGRLEPLAEAFRTRRAYVKGPGITLGIVSRLTPIKQFPLQFSLLAPILARKPEFRLEIFGAGGYASVRDLRQVLVPLGTRARFWGHQTAMRQVYGGIDYLLTGLPEKEALGLNVIEAQACGTPVLAVDAPPFTETVASEISGLFYCDPREDDGADFARLLDRLLTHPMHIDDERIATHLERFGEKAFAARVGKAATWVAERMGHQQ